MRPIQKPLFPDIELKETLQGFLFELKELFRLRQYAALLKFCLCLTCRVAVVSLQKLRNRCKGIMLDRRFESTHLSADNQRLMNNPVVMSVSATKQVETVMKPAPVTHPLANKIILFTKLKRVE